MQEKQLQAFYPPNNPALDQIASRAPALISQVMQRWKVAREIANDVVKLALYDVVLYIGMLCPAPNYKIIRRLTLVKMTAVPWPLRRKAAGSRILD